MKKLTVYGLLLVSFSASAQIRTNCESPEMSTILGYQDLVKFVTNYHNNTYGSSEEHTKALYINDSAILFLESFFLDPLNSKYYGFCLYFIDYNIKLGTHQRKNRQNFLYLAPIYNNTATGKDSTSDFGALNTYYTRVSSMYKKNKLNNSIPCFGTCDSSINEWTNNNPTVINYTRLHERNVNPANTNEVFLLSPNRSYHLTRRDNYEKRQGLECFGRQTKRVYFHKDVILRLAQFIHDGNNINDFPMIGVYFGSYNDWIIRSQGHPNQTTVNFVTMRKMHHGNLEPDVCSYIEFYERQRSKNKLLFMKDRDNIRSFTAENHGTLCPTQCPTGGN